MKLVIAEKPSVGKEIAHIVGANQSHEGYLEGNGYICSWCYGHLLGLYDGKDYNPEWKSWKVLPIIPDEFKLKVGKDKSVKAQFQILKKLMNRDDVDVVVCATDAGREGELIFRHVYNHAKCKKPVQRLWNNSMADIKRDLQHLQDGNDERFIRLYHSAFAREKADWLVGANLTRHFTNLYCNYGDDYLSIGRVQTPTLRMIVDRENEIKSFKKNYYYKVQLKYKDILAEIKDKYEDENEADRISKEVDGTCSMITDIKKEIKKKKAPLLHDIGSLQKECNEKLSISAKETLDTAQKLYEGGYISYPRTGCSYITEDIFEQVPSLIGLLKQHPRFTWHAENLCNQPLNRHCVDDSKMTDHHALIITENYPQRLSLDEQNIYSMIAGRMLEAFSGKCLKETVSVQADCNGVLFGIKGSQIKVPGWRGIYNEPSEKEEGSLLPEFQEDEILPVLGIDTLVKKTKPQPIFTEASLLAAMEGCGRTLDDEKEKEAMEDSGLGTPATRAGIIELLIARHYVERNGRSLIPTPKGLEVYDIVKEKMIANVSMTGGWECALHEIETGKVSTETFTQSINSYTQQITSELLALKLNHPDLPHCNCPKCGAETIIVFNKVAKCSDPNCGFLLFRTFNGRELTDNQMLLLLSGKRTGYLKFTSKKGKKYEASLELDDNYRIEMTFKDNKPKK